jgi:DNA-directed RNA polymerase subunit K/omega
MIFPLKELIEYKESLYEITAASSRRSYQLSMLYVANDDDIKYRIDNNNGKMVSLAAQQLLSGEVGFRIGVE